MKSDTQFAYELIAQLESALASLPAVHILNVSREVRFDNRIEVDAIMDAKIGGQPIRLCIEIKRDLYPRDTPQVAWQLEKAIKQSGGDESAAVVPMVLANAISKGAREQLAEMGIGYFDLSGSLSILAAGAYILIDQPARKSAKAPFTAIFEGKRSQILQAMWYQRSQWLSVGDAAEAAQVAASTASTVLSEMERRNWVEAKGRGPAKARRLTNATSMLDEWEEVLSGSRRLAVRHYYVRESEPRAIADQIATACHRYNRPYVLTGEFAAQLQMPFLSSISTLVVRLQHSRDQAAILDELQAIPVREGWNLGVIDTASEFDLLPEPGGQPFDVARPLRLWLDLLQLPGRSKDMAQHYRKELLQG